MIIHLKKLAVGVENIPDFRAQVARRVENYQGAKAYFITTRHLPKQADDLVKGGSLYWVVQGVISARQKILGFETLLDENGQSYCHVWLDAAFHLVVPTSHRPFQGWRYLKNTDAPADLPRSANDDVMPVDMAADLKKLGLI